MRFLVLALPLMLLAGCASEPPTPKEPAVTTAPTTPEPPSHMIVGSGTPDERAAIQQSNQNLYNLSHPAGSEPVANQGVP